MTDRLAHGRRRGGRGLSRALVTAALGVTLLFASPATAQWFGTGPDEDPLPPPTIGRMLARQGFQPLSRPRFQGDVYIVQALSPSGARVRLMIDAYNGSILRSVRLDEDLRQPPGVREFLDRETDLDALDDEPPRARRPLPQLDDEPARAQRPQPQLDGEPLRAQRPQPQPEPKAARTETPGRAGAGSAPRRSAPPSGAAVAPAPAMDRPKQDQMPKYEGAATDAAPPPSARQAPAATPPAPAPTIEAAKPEPEKTEPAKTAQERPAAMPGRPSQPVRVIEGVTPLRPEKPPGEAQEAKQ